ncbi:protein RRP5 homolog isoform X2 [Tubulanus polymorphus]
MSKIIEDFPRGGKKSLKREKENATVSTKKHIPDLFKAHQTSESDKKVAKKRKLNKRDDKKSKKAKLEEQDDEQDEFKHVVIERLVSPAVTQNMLLLGRVKDVQDLKLIVSLSNNVTGCVAITDICDVYTENLQSLTQNDSDKQDVCGLQDLFEIGTVVRCKVKDITEKKNKRWFELTLNPKEVNHQIAAADLMKGMVIGGFVSSIEDHGYIVDLGIKGIQAFVTTNAAEKYVKNKKNQKGLVIGEYLNCLVKDDLNRQDGRLRVTQVVVDPKVVEAARTPTSIPFSSLLPGMILQTTVQSVAENGISVKYSDMLKCSIHQIHLASEVSSYEKNQKVTACVLYVHPSRKSVVLTTLPHLIGSNPQTSDTHLDYPRGKIFNSVKVCGKIKKQGLLVKLSKDVQGFVPVREISDETVNEDSQPLNDFHINQKVKCRVIDFDFIDNQARLSMKKNVIEMKYMSLADINIGDIVEVTIKKLEPKRLVVKLSDWLSGLIFPMHYSDATIQHPEKFFTEGEKLTCRILKIEGHKAILTNKKSLVTSEIPIVKEINDFKPGNIVLGYILKPFQNYVLVGFYNHMKGIVLKREMNTVGLVDATQVFHSGQVVKCKVLDVEPEERVTLSFRLKAADIAAFSEKEHNALEMLEMNSLDDCKIVTKSDKGLRVRLISSGLPAIIPKHHLSDSLENCRPLLNMYQLGDVIKGAMCWNKHNIITLTLKKSLIQAKEKNLIPEKFEDLQEGSCYSGIIHKSESYGVFVSLPNDLHGLVLSKDVCDNYCANPMKVYRFCQSVKPKIIELDEVSGRVRFSLKMSDCYDKEKNELDAVEMLENCLAERKLILKSVFKGKTKFSKLKPGSIVKAAVHSIDGEKIKCLINSVITGTSSTKYSKGTEFEEGSEVDAVVLDIDIQSHLVEVSLCPELVKSVKKWKTSIKALKNMKSLKAEVLLVKSEYCIVSLNVNDASIIAYLPVKQHMNDLDGGLSFDHGKFLDVKVHSCAEDEIIVSQLESNKPSAKPEDSCISDKFQACITTIVKCAVIKKTDDGLIVKLHKPCGILAKIPKSYLTDSAATSDLLFTMYKPGDVIDDAVCYTQKSSDLILTTKKSMIQAAKDGVLPKSFDRIKVGQILPGIVQQSSDIGCFIKLNSGYYGLVPNKFISDVRGQDQVFKPLLTEGKSVAVKVMEVDAEKKRCILSLKMSHCFHQDPNIAVELLRNYLIEKRQYIEFARAEKLSICKYQVGQIVKAKIVKKTVSGTVCKVESNIGAICIYEHMIGVDCEVGNTMDAVVLFIDFSSKCLEISLDPKLVNCIQNRVENKANKVIVGQVLSSEVQLIKQDFALVLLKGHAVGRLVYIPGKRHMNDLLEEKSFQIGQVNKVVIKSVEDEIIAGIQHYEKLAAYSVDAPLTENHSHDLKIGSHHKAKITKILPYQMNIKIGDVPGRVYATEVYDNPQRGTKPFKKYSVGREIEIVVIGFRCVQTQVRLAITHPGVSVSMVDCSLRPSKLSGEITKKSLLAAYEQSPGGMFKAGDEVQVFVTENGKVMDVRVTPQVSGKIFLLNQSTDLKVLQQPKKSFHIGTICKATVVRTISANHLELSMIGRIDILPCSVTHCQVTEVTSKGASVLLANGMIGFASIDEVGGVRCQKRLKQKNLTQCFIFGQDKEKIWIVSLLQEKINSTFHQNLDEKCFNDFKVGDVLDAYINASTPNGKSVWLSKNQLGQVNFEKMCNVGKDLPFGARVAVKTLSLHKSDKSIQISMLEEDTGVKVEVCEPSDRQESRKRKRTISQCSETDYNSEKPKKQRERLLSVNEDEDSGVEDINEQHNKKGPLRLTLSTDFSWDNLYKPPALIATKKNDESEDSESESDEEEIVQPIQKKTKKEKAKEKAEEEKKIFENEKLALKGQNILETAADYDRLVLQSPNSSIVWIRYMAFHLETAEIDKARAVAERALKTISFREEQEKLNVWGAMMNVESTYGSEEDLKAVFDRAVQHNEPFEVFQQLIGIYISSEKHEAAELLYNKMLKRFSSQKKVWVNFGLFYYKQQRFDSARKLLQRALKCLEKRDHVEIISNFAKLEFKHGEPERGITMFENIVSNYPKRTDLWSVYIDMLILQGDMKPVRALFERVINLGFSAFKMKFFFKKYMEFEKKYGDEDSLNLVKQKAMDYVENKAASVLMT